MSGLVILFLVVVVIWALRRMGRMSPREVRAFQRQLLGIGLCAMAGFLILRGNMFVGLPLLGLGAGLLGLNHLLPAGLSQQSGPKAEQRQQPPERGSGNMGHDEALRVLGLLPGASVDEIKAAHKRLQRANHPDAGGTNYLAGKINQARDVLLNG